MSVVFGVKRCKTEVVPLFKDIEQFSPGVGFRVCRFGKGESGHCPSCVGVLRALEAEVRNLGVGHTRNAP